LRYTKYIPACLLIALAVLATLVGISYYALASAQGVRAASIHWFQLFSSEGINTLFRAVAVDNGRVFIAFQVVKEFFTVSVTDEDGKLIGSSNYYEVGNATVITPHGGYLYIGTNVGILLKVDEETMKPVFAYLIEPEGNKELPITDVRVANVEGKTYVLAAVELIDKPYSYIVVLLDRGDSLEHEVTWIIKTPEDSGCSPIEYMSVSNEAVYFIQVSEYSSIAYIGKLLYGEGSIEWAWSAPYVDASAHPMVAVSRDVLYAVVPLLVDGGSYGGLYAFSTKGELLLNVKVGDGVRFTYVAMAGNEKLYVVGDTLVKEVKDAVVCKVDPRSGEVLRAWSIGGDLDEVVPDPHCSAIAGYIYVGGVTMSYGYKGYTSAFTALLSPALAEGDIYKWGNKPPYSEPEDGVYVKAPEYVTSEGKVEEASLTIDKADSVIESIEVKSESVEVETYVAINEKTPEPVPEPWLITLAVIAIALLAIYRLKGRWA